MTLAERLLAIDADLSRAHALLNQIAMRYQPLYPLPPHLEDQLAPAIRDLTAARDALRDLAEGADKN